MSPSVFIREFYRMFYIYYNFLYVIWLVDNYILNAHLRVIMQLPLRLQNFIYNQIAEIAIAQLCAIKLREKEEKCKKVKLLL